MKVLKFGGSCLNSKADVERTVAIIQKSGDCVIVLSALKGVTDSLIALEHSAKTGSFDLSELEKKHFEVVAGLKKNKAECERKVRALLNDLKTTLTGISYLKEFSPQTHDKIVSFGERIVVEIMAAYLRDSGVEATALKVEETGIRTDSNFSDALVIEESKALIVQALKKAKGIPIVPGFVGLNEQGLITTLGRGGSDYTATFIAAALSCECVLLKDVDGLMTADPKVVPDAKIVKNVDYLDAMELAHYGSKVVFVKAVMPAMLARIPIRVKSFEKDNGGTVISAEQGSSVVVPLAKNVAIVELLGYTGMMTVFSSIVDQLGKKNIYPLLITESSACGEVSIVVDEKSAEKIERIAAPLMKGRKIVVEKGLAMVSVVGSSMKGKIGIAASVFDCLAKEKINVVAIAQSASERSISVVVEGDKAVQAAQALHKRFIK
ncbi:aspartate kinase [Candidatus Micrarchaeota archaeon]|nr:aspartate kinase [Candidatus Micrarchaeota archaeon]